MASSASSSSLEDDERDPVGGVGSEEEGEEAAEEVSVSGPIAKFFLKSKKPRADTGHTANVKAKERQRILPEKSQAIFYASGDRLFCKLCNIVVSHTRKSTIDRHIASAKHQRKAKKFEEEKKKGTQGIGRFLQSSLTSSKLLTTTTAQRARVSFCHDTVKLFASLNLPLGKVDAPAFREYLEKRVPESGSLPGADQITQVYLPDVYATEKEKLIKKLEGRKVAVMGDETTDAAGNCVFNILAAILDDDECGDEKLPVYLLEAVFIEKSNNITASQAVVRVVTDFHINFNNVLVFNSDNVAYMKKAFEDTLRVIFPNAVHVTCMAHITNVLADDFKKPFKLSITAFVKKFNAMLWHAHARRSRLTQFLKARRGKKLAVCKRNPNTYIHTFVI